MEVEYKIFNGNRHIGDVKYRGNEDKLPKVSRIKKENLSKFLKKITKGQCSLRYLNIFSNDYEVIRMIKQQDEVWK